MKASEADRTTTKSGRVCFVIMPFGGWFDEYWQHIYKPAIKAANLIARRADDVFRAGSVMSDVWRETQAADVILADLATRNSNVFYELGLAHAVGKPAVLISDNIEDVPFDLRALRVLLYDRNDPLWGVQLRASLTSALRETLEHPLLATPSTFASSLRKPQPARTAIKEAVDEPDLQAALSSPTIDPLADITRAFRPMHSRFPIVPPEIDYDRALSAALDELPKGGKPNK